VAECAGILTLLHEALWLKLMRFWEVGFVEMN
jgi:hypothetical protein